MTVDEARAEGRREAAPAALVIVVVFVLLAVVSRKEHWALIGLPWWVWLLVAVPGLLLTIDLFMARRGRGLVGSRGQALVLSAVLVLANFAALAFLVVGLVTSNTADLSGGELLLTAFAIWTADTVVFGILFWELDEGGPVARLLAPQRMGGDFRFPQDDNPQAPWRPQASDYLYVALTNAIAFSPTDTMPLSSRAKALMAFEAAISAVTILLVAARAVNVLGS